MKTNPRRITALLLLMAVFVPACTRPGVAYQALVTASDTSWNQTVGPEYEQYVRTDATLTDDQKAQRILIVKTMRDAVAAAQDELNTR